MAPYRVLMVDDEEDIRVGIIRKIEWESLGFSLVGEAENGQEALELAEQLRPDVVLSDIKMPFMDGLSLCKILTERLPASKFVIFSGFDDFEYAKQAVGMNISQYILKPINAPELSDILRKLKAQLDEERAEQQNIETIRGRYEESLPVLRELFLTRLLDGRVVPERMEGQAQRYDIDLSPKAWQVALVHLDSIPDQRELVTLSVQRLFEEHLYFPSCQVRTFLYGDAVALLVGYQEVADPYGLIDALNRICQLGQSYLDQVLTVGIGSPCHNPEAIYQSTVGAKNALDYQVLVGTGRAIYISDMEPDHATRLTFDANDEHTLTNAVKLGSEEATRIAVHSLICKVQVAGLALSQCHLFFLELLTCLLKLTRGADLDLVQVFGTQFTGSLQITDFTSPEALGDWCLERCLRIRYLIGRQRSDSTGRTVDKAKTFIKDHFDQSDLSVESLCEHLHLSPAYFSTLFKRETGMTFISYVTVVRMEEAARLLKETQDKTYLIAEAVGYLDPNYFSYVFKRHFGISPTKFRAN